MIKFSNLFSINKTQYVKTAHSHNDCIICNLIKGDDTSIPLAVYQDELIQISINLYPYNSGHIMLYPLRHITKFEEITDQEQDRIFSLTKYSIKILNEKYTPCGFNIGYNIGQNAGASIAHLHEHIIPRYPNELGVIDIIGGAKILIEDPIVTRDNLIQGFNNFKQGV